LRDQVEAEQSALRDRKLEREARQLRRRLELAEAQQEPPPPPTDLFHRWPAEDGMRAISSESGSVRES
jgi:hypothetical protein